ncbi:MAG: hypothetical protein AAFN41_08055, partial [Planctomycetota bacterium]
PPLNTNDLDQLRPNRSALLLAPLVREITRLTRDELDQFARRARARLKAIDALKKVVEGVDFKAKDNEKEIQKLLERNPWLLDPTYTQFLSADVRADTMFDRLAKHLKIGSHAAPEINEKVRPDLVFLLGAVKLGRLVIVELKSANKALDSTCLDQLEGYMEDAESWLGEHGRSDMRVEGHLVGSKADPKSNAKHVLTLRRRIRKAGADTQWKVRDYLDVLRDTEAAHQELLDARVDDPQEPVD